MYHFRWLHISDLHIMANQQNDDLISYLLEGVQGSYDQLEKKGIRGILQECGGVDCIVATGDFFHQGHFPIASKRRVSDTLKRIYQVCSEMSGWGWRQDQEMDRLCFCPGNHDLVRDERYYGDDGAYVYRESAVRAEADKRPEPAYLNSGDNDKKLIVEQSFKSFFEHMLSLNSQGKCFENNQIICFEPKARDFPIPVKMIGLNTALLSGYKVVDKNTSLLNSTVQSLKDACDRCACEDAKQAFEKWLENAMLSNGKIDDYQRLCLPEEKAFNRVANEISQSIPILFGHHSFDYFNKNARNNLNYFVNSNQIHTYLCGHSHQVYDHPVGQNRFARVPDVPCLEVMVGGLFWDNEKFNQITFSIGTIEYDGVFNPNNIDAINYNIFIEYYTCVRAANADNAGIWMRGESRRDSCYRSLGDDVGAEMDDPNPLEPNDLKNQPIAGEDLAESLLESTSEIDKNMSNDKFMDVKTQTKAIKRDGAEINIGSIRFGELKLDSTVLEGLKNGKIHSEKH